MDVRAGILFMGDVVQAIMLVLKGKDGAVAGETFNVATGQATSVNTVADMTVGVFQEHRGGEVDRVHLPPRQGEAYIPNFCLSPIKSKINCISSRHRTSEKA